MCPPDEYIQERHLLNSTKAAIETAAETVANNDATAGQTLLADGNRGSEWGNLDPENVKLSADMYTYAPVGKITDASNTHPVKVGSEGDSLSSVFTAIFGEQEDQDPVINKNTNFNFSQSSNYTQEDREVGTYISSKNISFAVSNIEHNGSASYGLNYGNNQSIYTSVNFTYPLTIKKINNLDYNFKIISTSSDYALISEAQVSSGSGEIVYRDSSAYTLYCKLNASNEFSMSFSLPERTVTTSLQQVLGSVTIGSDFSYSKAQYNDSDINYFYTYLKNEFPDTSEIIAGSFSNKNSAAYTIPAGKYYPYYYFSTASEISVLNSANKITNLSGNNSFFLTKSSGQITSDNRAGKVITTVENGYIWVFIPENSNWNVTNSTSIYQFVMGQWNMMDTYHSSVLLTFDSGRQERCYALRTAELTPNDWQVGVCLT